GAVIKEIAAPYDAIQPDNQPFTNQQQLLLERFNQLPRHEKKLVLEFIEQRIRVCEQMLTDMLSIKGLDVVSREEDAKAK
ncbi:MAG: hypothetical protein EBR59_08775, partial [Methylococcaceae bacterium]|nr:hypothetical protein [Methylococcaceae bacterium]